MAPKPGWDAGWHLVTLDSKELHKPQNTRPGSEPMRRQCLGCSAGPDNPAGGLWGCGGPGCRGSSSFDLRNLPG